jgi:hypothetical protein
VSAHSFVGRKQMSNEQIFRITENILSFQPYARNKHNLLNDPYQILSSIYRNIVGWTMEQIYYMTGRHAVLPNT